jgi:probable biosynthetic protein (TIGR04098 family)
MHCTHSTWHLGMPHTIRGALGEVALLAHAQDLHWKELGALAGCPASRFRDAAGSEVYASIYFAEFDGGGASTAWRRFAPTTGSRSSALSGAMA